jgi:hypothetical protein
MPRLYHTTADRRGPEVERAVFESATGPPEGAALSRLKYRPLVPGRSTAYSQRLWSGRVHRGIDTTRPAPRKSTDKVGTIPSASKTAARHGEGNPAPSTGVGCAFAGERGEACPAERYVGG